MEMFPSSYCLIAGYLSNKPLKEKIQGEKVYDFYAGSSKQGSLNELNLKYKWLYTKVFN